MQGVATVLGIAFDAEKSCACAAALVFPLSSCSTQNSSTAGYDTAEPASGEIAALLFALQAAIGAGFIGYWLGSVVTRERLRQAAEANKDQRAD